jgi:hypothetical protein
LISAPLSRFRTLFFSRVECRCKIDARGWSPIVMADESALRDLFDRWERVWHEGRFDLVPGCIGPHYIWHGEAGGRTVIREAYAAEIAKVQEERPDIRVVVYDHTFQGNRAWFRFAFRWTDTKTGEARSHAGIQDGRVFTRSA